VSAKISHDHVHELLCAYIILRQAHSAVVYKRVGHARHIGRTRNALSSRRDRYPKKKPVESCGKPGTGQNNSYNSRQPKAGTLTQLHGSLIRNLSPKSRVSVAPASTAPTEAPGTGVRRAPRGMKGLLGRPARAVRQSRQTTAVGSGGPFSPPNWLERRPIELVLERGVDKD
jgi:hypothetical protein